MRKSSSVGRSLARNCFALTATLLILAGSVRAAGTATPTTPAFNLDQAITDRAQSTTMAFSGFGMITGNLGAQTFFPPGKVADYWGFQYLRDNDPSDMGHNTSFLTRISSNVLYILSDAQLAELKTLAKNQVASINLYGWKRYPLMKAFRRLMDGTGPAGSTGLSLTAVKSASKDLYVLDGQISYERAVVYASIYRSLSTTQKAYLDAMVGKGYSGWPDKSENDVRTKTQGLTHDEVVAVMTYAGDLYSWYAGSLTGDVYFCPERHGTYFGSFFIKDAPAVGHPGYGIDETMTAVIGSALVESSQGYISSAGATLMNALVTTQRQNLYANATSNIVLARTKISEALRSLISSTAPAASTLASVKATVDQYSQLYGELDGENNYNYATTFYRVANNVGGTYLTSAQKTALAALRKKYMTVTYADGVTIDFSADANYYLYAAEVFPTSADFLKYTGDAATDSLFETATQSMAVTAGWNLLGNGTSTAIDVATVFGNSANVESVWTWLASSGKWAFYSPTLSDSGVAYAATHGYVQLQTISGGQGYWLYAKNSFAPTLPSGTPIASASLSGLASGWSLIAVGDSPTAPSFASTISGGAATSSAIAAKLTSLWAWDAATQKWFMYAPSLAATGSSALSDYNTSHGYLDFATTGKLLGSTTGFWINKP